MNASFIGRGFAGLMLLALVACQPSPQTADILGHWMSPDIPPGQESQPFKDVPFLSRMSDAQAKTVLAGVEDQVASGQKPTIAITTLGSKPKDYLWRNTEHRYGFIEPTSAAGDIVHAGNIQADASLKGQRVTMRLNHLRVADYPGDGLHKVLFDFRATNTLMNGSLETVSFNQAYRVMEGQGAGIIGFPIYKGLSVGNDGVDFQAFTVNVSNDADENLLKIFESDAAKQGLQLLTTAQPAIAPFVSVASAIFRMVATRRRNVPVQDVFMGLDFSSNQQGARLRIGDYVIVQVPDAETANWNWAEWKYDKNIGVIVMKSDGKTLIPYNYFVVSLSRA
jgi:hypothetical protein